MRLCVLTCLLLAASAASAASGPPLPPLPPLPALRDGDVVLHTSRSAQSRPIQEATGSPFSHVGLVEVVEGQAWVVEAVQPVKRTPLAAWRARGAGGRLAVLRHRGLTPEASRRVVAEARAFLGRPYDAAFGWDDARLYCSELVAKAYARGAGLQVGRMQRLGSLKVGGLGPALRARYGKAGVPLERELLTPASLAEDAGFAVVYSDFPPPPPPAARDGAPR